jgi:exopolyphosphatase / guanosine-5'-triphosphate,3'-diphosphate pyrophosphatase
MGATPPRRRSAAPPPAGDEYAAGIDSPPEGSAKMRPPSMLCAAIDIGSNTTRVLVAEPREGQLRTIMEQRAYTRIGKSARRNGAVVEEKVREIAEAVATQVRLAQEVGAEAIRTVATAAIRDADNQDDVVAEIERIAGVDVEVLSEHEEGRLAFVGATKTLGHPAPGEIGVVDVGGGSTEVVTGTIVGGVEEVRSFAIGSGLLADTFLSSDPPAASELRAVREHIAEFFEAADFPHPEQAVAVGGSATSLRKVVGAMLEYETLERAMRIFASEEVGEVARRFELDPTRVRILPTGVLLLEKLSELLGQPLRIGKGGLREGVILDLLGGGGSANGHAGGASGAELA